LHLRMGGAFSLSRLYPDRDGSKRVQTMTTVPKDDFRPLPYLVALGAVGAATVGVFFYGPPNINVGYLNPR
jgi:hypothetical protein